MGTTLDMLTGADASSAGAITISARIEGFPPIVTDGHPGQVFTAYSASGTFGDPVSVVNGLVVHWDMDQSVTPWKPFMDPMAIKLEIAPGAYTTSAAYEDVPGIPSDIVGETIGKRTGGTETNLVTAIDCDATSIVCQRADDFAASGTLYMGPETITYSARDTGTDTFTVSARGRHPAAVTSTDANFSHPHAPTTYTSPQQNVSLNPIISTEPRTWIGRWVAVWIHRRNGDTLDVPEADGSAAHLAFAGQIVGVDDADGRIVIACEDIRRKINETVFMKNPFRAKVAEGIRLVVGQQFSVTTWRQISGGAGTTGTGDNLVVVAAGASGSNQVNAGLFTAAALGETINAWLQGEKSAARIIFNLRYEPMFQDADGPIRGRLSMNDPTSTSGLLRTVALDCNFPAPLRFLGWTSGSIAIESYSRDGSSISDQPPLRITFTGTFDMSTLILEQPRGSWISQASTLPSSLRDPAGTIDGIVRVNNLGYVRAGRVSDTEFTFSFFGLESFFPGNMAALANTNGNSISLTVEDDLSLEVEQVILMSASFKTLLLKMILSTGTAGFNHATYDDLDEQLSCAIPFSFVGSTFITEVGQLECADLELTALVRKPTRFVELFEADFILRRCFMVWGAGRLQMRTWATPLSGYATSTLNETTKGIPVNVSASQRAHVTEVDDFRNLIKIKYGPNAEGELQDEVTLVDQSSIRDHGERSITVNARNTFRQAGAVGNVLDDLVAIFAGYMVYTSRPWLVVRRPIDHQKNETTTPGTVVSLTDKYVRDPSTGRRYSNLTATGGLSGYPGMVVRSRFSWGGSTGGSAASPGGEVDVMISPQRTMATYVPCAQFDEGAANAGYVVGTKVITAHAHKFTESSESADASFFGAGDKVFVLQIDSTSPLSWSDEVASQTGNTITLVTGLAGFDNTARYVIMYDAYSTVTTTQKTKCYQADDADGLVSDAIQAYAFSWFGSTQGSVNPTSEAANAVQPALISSSAYGDGRPMDVWHDINAARTVHALMDYRSAPQQPTAYASGELRNFTGAGTWQLVEIQPVFVGMQQLLSSVVSLSVAPRLRSTSGATAEVRVRLCRYRPTGTTADDVTFVDPYESATFTTTSTTFSVPTAVALDINHLKLSDGLLGGVGYLTIEVKTATEVTGLARCVIGAPS